MVIPHEPLKTCFFVYCVSYGFYGCEPCWLSKLGVLGSHLSGGVLESCGALYWVPTLCSSGCSWELGLPSWLYGAVPGVGFMIRVCLSLSYHLNVGFISFAWYVVIIHLVSGFLLKEIVPWVAIDLVCPWRLEVTSGASYVTIWDQNPWPLQFKEYYLDIL